MGVRDTLSKDVLELLILFSCCPVWIQAVTCLLGLPGLFSLFLPAFLQPTCPQAAENRGTGKVASAGLLGGGSYAATLVGWWDGRSCFLLLALL